jgi:TolA-binding protein
VAAPVGLARNKAQLAARRQLTSPSAGSSSRIVAPPPTQKWKTFAVHEASFLVTARDLIRDGYLFVARDVLNSWEIQFPLSKMNGDYSLAEAEFYVAAGIYPRAIRILKLARQGTDISSFLPATYALELECLRKMGNDKEAKELAKTVAREFPNHECGVLARRILNDL